MSEIAADERLLVVSETSLDFDQAALECRDAGHELLGERRRRDRDRAAAAAPIDKEVEQVSGYRSFGGESVAGIFERSHGTTVASGA